MTKKILKEELIGKQIKVIDAQNKSLINLCGVIIDETRNVLVIEDEHGAVKKLLKSQITILIDTITIEGKTLIGRSEERLKK